MIRHSRLYSLFFISGLTSFLLSWTAFSQQLQQDIFWREAVPDEKTELLLNFNDDKDETTSNAITPTYSVRPTAISDGRFRQAVRLVPGNELTVTIPKVLGKKPADSRTLDGWIRVQEKSDGTLPLWRVGDVNLSLSEGGALSLWVGETRFDMESDTRIELGKWTHLSLMMRFRYNDLALVRVTVNGRVLFEQALDSTLIPLIRLAIRDSREFSARLGYADSRQLTIDLDDFRVTDDERQFYDYRLDNVSIPVESSLAESLSDLNVDSNSSAISFWYRPVNWDTRPYLVWGRQWKPKWGEKKVPILSLGSNNKTFRPLQTIFVNRELGISFPCAS